MLWRRRTRLVVVLDFELFRARLAGLLRQHDVVVRQHVRLRDLLRRLRLGHALQRRGVQRRRREAAVARDGDRRLEGGDARHELALELDHLEGDDLVHGRLELLLETKLEGRALLRIGAELVLHLDHLKGQELVHLRLELLLEAVLEARILRLLGGVRGAHRGGHQEPDAQPTLCARANRFASRWACLTLP